MKNFRSLLNYMQMHYQTVTLSKLALAFNYSERQIIRIFKKNTGKGFSELLTEIRMNKAIQLLKTKIFQLMASHPCSDIPAPTILTKYFWKHLHSHRNLSGNEFFRHNSALF